MYKLTGSAIVRNDEDHKQNLAYNLAKANFKDIQNFYDEKCIKQNKSHLFFEKELDRTNDKHPCHKTPIPYCKFSIGGQYEEGATRFVEGEKVPFQTSDLRELVRDMPYEIKVCFGGVIRYNKKASQCDEKSLPNTPLFYRNLRTNKTKGSKPTPDHR